MAELTRVFKDMEKKYIKLNGGKTPMKKTTKKAVKKVRKIREVLTQKKALELLALVQSEVEKGDMGVTAACRKYNFPIHKYSYWKKMKEEMDALDEAIEQHERENPEVLYDSSPLAIKAKNQIIESRNKSIDDLNKDNSKLWEIIQTLQVENTKLKDAILKKEGIL